MPSIYIEIPGATMYFTANLLVLLYLVLLVPLYKVFNRITQIYCLFTDYEKENRVGSLESSSLKHCMKVEGICQMALAC